MLFTYQGYQVVFSSMLPPDKGYIAGDILFMPESFVYQFIFMNNQVNDQTVQFAIDYAIRKIHRFIDSL